MAGRHTVRSYDGFRRRKVIIAYLSTFHGKEMGGAERSIELLASQLRELANFHIQMFSTRRGSTLHGYELMPYTSWLPDKVLLLGNGFLDRFVARSLATAMRQEGGFQLLHVQDLFGLPASVLAASELQIPVIATVRDPIPKQLWREDYGLVWRLAGEVLLRRRAMAWASFVGYGQGSLGSLRRRIPLTLSRTIWLSFLEECSGIIAVSHYVRKNLISLGIEAAKIRVVYNLPEMWSLDDSPRRPPGSSRALLAAGRLFKEKGFDVLIRAVRDLVDTGLECTLTIVGSGNYGRRLRDLVNELALEPYVRFPGKVPYAAMRRFYSESDAVIVPSVFPEPFGRVALEAMMAAKPVVASAVGALPELVLDGYTGILVPPGDAMALAKAIAGLFVDEQTRLEMGRNGRRLALERFHPWQQALKVAHLYDSLLR